MEKDSPSYFQPPRYTIKYTFPRKYFSVHSVSGEIIDSLLATEQFDCVEVSNDKFPHIKIIKAMTNEEKPLFHLDYCEEFVRYESFVGENFPEKSINLTKIFFNSLKTKIKPQNLGIGVLYSYILKKEELNIIWEKFNTINIYPSIYETSKVKEMKEILYKNVWTNADDSIKYFTHIMINKAFVETDTAACSIYYDGIYNIKNVTDDLMTIKEFLKFTVNSNEIIMEE